MHFQLELQLIASVTAIACVIPGTFLVLRKMALISDAISHSILFGIVIAFALVKNFHSPLLIIGAGLTGILSYLLVELIKKTRLLKEDASIGLVFPLLFSLGVILVSTRFSDVHLDVDAVLLGELVFAPFERLSIGGTDLGPKSLYLMGTILLVNLTFLFIFFKELKLSTFDPGLAASLGFFPGLINYGLIASVSFTSVGAFDSVGAILVIALMIVPPATALLLTDDLKKMILIAVGIGILSALSGYWLSHWTESSVSGMMASMTGVFFIAAFLFAPQKGIIAQFRRRRRQRFEFAQMMLLVHLLHHEPTPESSDECSAEQVYRHLGWPSDFTGGIIERVLKRSWVRNDEGLLLLTPNGKEVARKAMIADASLFGE